jgi:hypothetical protein
MPCIGRSRLATMTLRRKLVRSRSPRRLWVKPAGGAVTFRKSEIRAIISLAAAGRRPRRTTMTKIEWRLRAVTRYILTRFETTQFPAAADTEPMSLNKVDPIGEFASLSHALRMGEAMAHHDRAHARDGLSDVTFDGISLPGAKVRCKMTCVSAWPGLDEKGKPTGGGMVTMFAVFESGAADGGNAAIENRIFSKATPNASVQMQINNPEAFARFKQGDHYYLDFIPVPKEGELLPLDDA